MSNQKERTRKHSEICKDLTALYEAKNVKYDNSFAKTFSEYGPESVLLRLDDKISRAKFLLRNPATPPGDETVKDTLMDLANYAIMGIMELFPQAEVVVAEAVPKKKKKKNEEQPSSAPAPQSDVPAEFEEYTKDELVKVGEFLDLKLNRKRSKSELVAAILEKPKKQVKAALAKLDAVGDDTNEKEEAQEA